VEFTGSATSTVWVAVAGRHQGPPIVAAWMQYYGRFYPSALYRLPARINAYLVRWIRNKYRRYDKTRAARRKFAEITSEDPRMFRHWRWVTSAW
jgi:RNA-directed DNA polymerase